MIVNTEPKLLTPAESVCFLLLSNRLESAWTFYVNSSSSRMCEYIILLNTLPKSRYSMPTESYNFIFLNFYSLKKDIKFKLYYGFISVSFSEFSKVPWIMSSKLLLKCTSVLGILWIYFLPFLNSIFYRTSVAWFLFSKDFVSLSNKWR